jgi:hypothetical protein
MRLLVRCAIAAGTLWAGACGYGQTASKAVTDEMSLADLRAYMDVLHIRDADERGVRVQMEAQKKQLPPWFPPALLDEMTTAMLKVDFAAVEYPFVKPCLSGAGIHAMTAMFATPEGQAYANKATGAMVDKEAKGKDPLTAHQEMEKEDSGLPSGAIEKLPPAQRELVNSAFKSGSFDCLSDGFRKGSVEVTTARTQAAREALLPHRAELQAAKEKYDAANPAAKPQ